MLAYHLADQYPQLEKCCDILFPYRSTCSLEQLMTHHPHPPHGAGKSSFDLIDPEILFPALHLKPGEAILDLGCGEGRYTLPLASRVGKDGWSMPQTCGPRVLNFCKTRPAGLRCSGFMLLFYWLHSLGGLPVPYQVRGSIRC